MTTAACDIVWHIHTCDTCNRGVMWNGAFRPTTCPFGAHEFKLKANPRFLRGFWKLYFRAGKCFDYGTVWGISLTWLRRTLSWNQIDGWSWQRHNKWGN